MSLDELNKLIEFMNEHGLVELEIEEDGKRVRLRKGASAEPVAAAALSAAPSVPAPAAAAVSASEAAPPVPSNLIEITSPMVGTYYQAPTPDGKPFVEIGDPVGPETAVCIVEAMKVMNELPAGCSGTIQQICVEDGEPVEYGQVLFRVQP